MIRIGDNNLVPLSQVPKLLPVRASGKPVHISAVYRWVQRGVRGTRLETLKVGGTTYTTLEALQRFAEAATRAGQEASGGGGVAERDDAQVRVAVRSASPAASTPARDLHRQRTLASVALKLEEELGIQDGRLLSQFRQEDTGRHRDTNRLAGTS